MSRRADPPAGPVGRHVVLALMIVGVLLAARAWDRPIGSDAAAATSVPAEACVEAAASAHPARTEAFALGGTVVRAERWCGVAEVVVEVQGDAAAGLVLVAATTEGTRTLSPGSAVRARLGLGSDGWVAIGLVQGDARSLADGGAWVTVTAGASRR